MVNFKSLIKTWILPPGIYGLMSKMQHCPKNILFSDEEKKFQHENILLKDKHTGQRCFILGAGSSIKDQDISKLKGEIVISVSNTFVHPEFTKIKPKYHILPPLLRSHGRMHSEEKFTVWLQEMEIATGNAEMFLHIGDREMILRNQLFKGRILHWVDYVDWSDDSDHLIDIMRLPPIWSVSELALTVAVNFGFEEIYLIGIDHDWFNDVMVYFYDHTKEHALRPHECDLSFADSEFQMRRHADIFKRYKHLQSIKQNIFNANANPRHYLDVFPKVNFNDLFTQSGGDNDR